MTVRIRRNRKYSWMRDLFANHEIKAKDLILPIFLIEGINIEQKIDSLPGVSRFSVDLAIKEIQTAINLGIKAIILFPVIEQGLKSNDAIEATNENNLICRAVKAFKNEYGDKIGIICDVALDPYTSHGHDGIIDNEGYVLNDETVEILCQQALCLAKAGCHVIAPSDMMDGRVAAIREILDKNGFINVSIMSYAAKYASSFYNPFRNAVGSDNNLKKADKKSYQLDFRNNKEHFREVYQDEKEGCDMIIIKPAMLYLDILQSVSNSINLPVIAYQVSAEYAMIKFASLNNSFDFMDAMIESLTSCKRAGADAIICYAAIEVAKYVNKVI